MRMFQEATSREIVNNLNLFERYFYIIVVVVIMMEPANFDSIWASVSA